MDIKILKYESQNVPKRTLLNLFLYPPLIKKRGEKYILVNYKILR